MLATKNSRSAGTQTPTTVESQKIVWRKAAMIRVISATTTHSTAQSTEVLATLAVRTETTEVVRDRPDPH